MKDQLQTTRGKIALGAVALVLVLAAGWFFGVAPKRSDAKELAAATAAAQVQLAEKQAALARPSANVEIKASDLFRLTKAMPDATDGANVMLDIDRLAKRNKLSFVSILPGAAVTGVGALQHPYEVIVQGRFSNLSRFVTQLRSLVMVKHKRLVVKGQVYTIDGVDVGKPSTGGGKLDFPNVQATVRMSAFSFTDPGPVAAPGTTPTTPTDTSSGTVAAGATP